MKLFDGDDSIVKKAAVLGVVLFISSACCCGAWRSCTAEGPSGEQSSREARPSAVEAKAKPESSGEEAPAAQAVDDTARAAYGEGESFLVRLWIKSPESFESEEGDLPDLKGYLEVDGDRQRFGTAKDVAAHEFQVQLPKPKKPVHLELKVEDGDVLGDDLLSVINAQFDGAQLWAYKEPVLFQILPESDANDYSLEQFESDAPERFVKVARDQKLAASAKALDAAKAACAEEHWTTCIDSAEKVEADAEQVEMARELLETAHKKLWKGRFGRRGRWYTTKNEETKFVVSSAMELREFRNRKQDYHFDKSVLEPPKGHRWVVVNLKEVNLSNELASAEKYGGIKGAGAYRLVDHYGATYSKAGGDIARYYNRRYTKEGFLAYIDVRTKQTWNFNVIFAVPAEVPNDALYLKTPPLARKGDADAGASEPKKLIPIF